MAKTAYDQAQADKSQVDAAKENVNSSQAAYDEAVTKVAKRRSTNNFVKLIRNPRARRNNSAVMI